jgi:hypothetical protein
MSSRAALFHIDDIEAAASTQAGGKTYDEKYVISLFSKQEGLIGVIDVERDYPQRGA